MTFALRSMMPLAVTLLLAAHFGSPAGSSLALAGNWPMYRANAARSAATDDALPDELQLSWTRQLPALSPTWPDQLDLREDSVYQPVVWEDLLLLASSRNDTVTAYDVTSGSERWRFYADGPVRFAPAIANGRAVFGSDDGYVYCLNVADGKLLWKHQAAPREHRVLGNQRLSSAWPVRGAPVVDQGQVYVTASIWPFMGIFVYALDLADGHVVWQNDGTGSTYTVQPHNSPAFSSIAPQGYLAVNGDRLLVPNGRSVPACFDRTTGELLYFHLSQFRKAGGYTVAASKPFFLTAGHAFLMSDGEELSSKLGEGTPVFDSAAMYASDGKLTAFDSQRLEEEKYKDRLGRDLVRQKLRQLWQANVDCQVHIKAGPRLYGYDGSGDSAKVVAVEVAEGGNAQVAWETPIEGTPAAMAAAAERLFVVTEEGLLHCYAATDSKQVKHWSDETNTAAAIAKTDGVSAALAKHAELAEGGYALVLGLSDGAVVRDLLARTKLYVMGVDRDAETVDRLRRELDAAGLYGERVSLHAGDPLAWHLPPYLASLIVSETPGELTADLHASRAKFLFERLRPYGGLAVLEVPAGEAHSQLVETLKAADLPHGEVTTAAPLVQLERVGSLPGSAPWTHQYADAGNSSVSRDSLVKAPLGVLWFGGPSNQEVLPRHGHGPSEQVVGGRLFIEGPDMLRAVDVYTGRLLWQRDFPGIGNAYDNTAHQPGANSVGSNYVSVADGIYVAYRDRCLRLDPATGKTLREFALPQLDLPTFDESANDAKPSKVEQPHWGYLTVWEDLLLAGAAPQSFDGDKFGGNTYDGTSSSALIAFNRHTGQILWQRMAKLGFRHNAIVVGKGEESETDSGLVFCIDRLPDAILEKLERRGLAPKVSPMLFALDVATGEVRWSTDKDVFGTWLGYNSEFDVVVEAGRASRDMLRSEPTKRMITFAGATGKVLWDLPISYGGPVMLHHDTIITQGAAFDLHSGEPRVRQHPITGEMTAWEFSRNYGCNAAVASECLLTFRSAAAGFYDLSGDGGTGNLGGFRSSCTSNLIVADGVLNAPDYTRTCTCAYQNQASLALVHMPESELWTFNRFDRGKEPVQQLAINFGAPGDRKASDETLWFEFPVIGGPSPDIDAKYTPVRCKWYRYHPSSFSAEAKELANESRSPAWVASSGAEGCEKLVIEVNPKSKTDTGKQERRYRVRIHFAEPNEAGGLDRRFSIRLQDKVVRPDFCPAEVAGGPRVGTVVVCEDVAIREEVEIELTPTSTSKLPPVISGIEIIAVQ